MPLHQGSELPADPIHTETKHWAIACTIIALGSVYAFFQDIIAPDWPAWVLSPLIVVGFRGAVSVTPDESLIRAALYQAALLIVPFMGVYGLADAVFAADWPAWVIAPLVVALLWTGMAAILEIEAE